MGFDWSITSTFKGWGEALASPLGIIFLFIAAIYIFLRVTGRIEGIKGIKNKNNNSNNQKVDYILKRGK